MSKLISLVQKLQTGKNDSVFSDIYNLTVRQFYAHALTMTNGDTTLAEDVVQETFLSISEHISELKSPEAFSSWAYQLERTQANRIFRKNHGETVTEGDSAMFMNKETNDVNTIPHAAYERMEKSEALMAMISALPPDQRDIVNLRFLSGLSTKQTAAALGESENTIKSRLRLAKEKLKIMMKERKEYGLPCFAVMPMSVMSQLAVNGLAIPASVVSSIGSAAGITSGAVTATSIATKSTFGAIAAGIGTKAVAATVAVAVIAGGTGTAVAVTHEAEVQAAQAAVVQAETKDEKNAVLAENGNSAVVVSGNAEVTPVPTVAASPTPAPTATPTPTVKPSTTPTATTNPSASASATATTKPTASNGGSGSSGTVNPNGNPANDAEKEKMWQDINDSMDYEANQQVVDQWYADHGLPTPQLPIFDPVTGEIIGWQ